MTQRTIEPYRDETLPERFLRWIETIRARFKTIPNYTEFTGSPEGVIFGQKADRYYDLTADEVYIKTTASGNTGWVLITTGGGDATFQGLGQWRYRTTTTGTPGAGRLEFDNVDINLATEFYLNVTNDNGVDMTAFLGLINANDLVYIQVSNDSAKYVVTQVGLPVLAAGVYTFPIILAEGVGGGVTNNTPVSIVVAAPSGGGGGIANGTVEGSMLAWDVGNVAWEERTNVTYEEQVDYGQGLGNWLTIDNQVGNNTGIRMLVPGIEDLVIYADDADFITKVETQALQFSAPSGSNFLHTLRAGYVNNNNNIEFSNVAGPGKAIRTHTLGGFLELTAGNGASDVRIINGSTLKLQERTGALADTALMGQLYVDDSDQGLYYKFNGVAAVRLDASGGAPGGLTTEVQYNDAGSFQGSDGFVWDEVNRRLILDRTGGAGAAIKINRLLANTPALEIGGAFSSSTNHIVWRTYDQSGSFFWQLFDDHSLSSGNHRLSFQNQSATKFLEFDNSGELRVGGGESFAAFTIFGIGGTLKTLFMDNGNGGFYMEEQAAQGAAVAGDMQWWTRNDAPCVPMVTDDTGVRQELDPSYSRIVDFSGDTTLTIFSKGLTYRYTGAVAAQTLTIPANASVAYRLGAWIAVDNDGTVDISIAITTDTMTGTDGATGTRTLGPDQRALIQKLTATTWRYQATDI